MRLVVSPWLLAAPLLLSCPGVLSAQPRPRSPNYGESSTVELEVRRWESELVSELRVSGAGVPGTDLSPMSLELPEETTWDYRAAVRLTRRLKARASLFRVDYDAETVAQTAVAVAGLEVPVGRSLSTRLDLEQLRIGAEFDVLTGDYGFVAVVGEYGRFRAESVFAAGEEEVAPEYRIELPLLGVKARVYLTPTIALTVEGVGMKRESRGVMTDFEATATFNLIPNLAINYGYRNSYHRVNPVEISGDRALFRLRGQNFGVTIRF